MCCKSEQSNNCFDKIFLVRIWKFTPVLVWLKALVRIHNLIQECLMFWFFWSDETHGDAEILGMQIWNFRYANMDFFKTPHIQIWFLGKDLVFKYESLSTFICPWMHCLQKGPYFKDLLLNKDLFGILGPYLYFRVLIFTILVSFTQRMSIQSACIRIENV